jgi:hypothetical protein
MSALKRCCLFLLLGAFACEGPTLWVGELRDAAVDAADSEPAVDASVDANLAPRDAQARDGGVVIIPPIIRCLNSEPCTRELPRCHSELYRCTQCEFDRDCKQNEWCDYWVCRSKGDDDRGPGGGTTGGAP